MINDNRYSNMTNDEINEIAKKYSDAKNSGDKNAVKHYYTELFRITIENTELNNKLKSQIYMNTMKNKLKNDIDFIISGYAMKQIKYYHTEKNDNFSAYILKFFKQYLGKLAVKELKNGDYAESIEDMTTEEDGSINEKKLKEVGSNEFCNDEERALLIRQRIPTLITNFYKHTSKKEATKARYNYFRIFNTESIASLIYQSGNTRYFNKTEAYESTDKDYIKFISYSDYEKLDDLIFLKFKRYTDIFDNYPDAEKTIEKLPCEQKIVAEYLYKSGLGEKRPEVQSVSDFYNKYLKYCRGFFEI